MYAIVEISGKQFKVEKNKTIYVDKLSKSADERMEINTVMLFSDGEKIMVGQPFLNNVKISATVVGDVKDKKVRGMKFKKRKNYARTLGHRAQFTGLKINELAVV